MAKICLKFYWIGTIPRGRQQPVKNFPVPDNRSHPEPCFWKGTTIDTIVVRGTGHNAAHARIPWLLCSCRFVWGVSGISIIGFTKKWLPMTCIYHKSQNLTHFPIAVRNSFIEQNTCPGLLSKLETKWRIRQHKRILLFCGGEDMSD